MKTIKQLADKHVKPSPKSRVELRRHLEDIKTAKEMNLTVSDIQFRGKS